MGEAVITTVSVIEASRALQGLARRSGKAVEASRDDLEIEARSLVKALHAAKAMNATVVKVMSIMEQTQAAATMIATQVQAATMTAVRSQVAMTIMVRVQSAVIRKQQESE